VWDCDTFRGINQIEHVEQKFLNFVAYKLKIDHPPHNYILVMLGLNMLADRRFEANLYFLSHIIDGIIDLTELLKQFNLKVPTFHARHM